LQASQDSNIRATGVTGYIYVKLSEQLPTVIVIRNSS